ncbi:hypothetical protein [Paraglaciecola hydrolytica]|nr:hypothetical protein [Paraglaciecola hydrolytica]
MQKSNTLPISSEQHVAKIKPAKKPHKLQHYLQLIGHYLFLAQLSNYK